MVSPYLSKKKNESLTVSLPIKKIFQAVYRQKEKGGDTSGEDETKIVVSELISKLTFFYEKIRNYVDYNEEHLHRKNAIKRILKRHLVIESAVVRESAEDLSRNLLCELIRAGYLPNNKIPEKKIDDVKLVLEKYIKLRQLAMPHGLAEQMEKIIDKEKREFSDWLLGIAASEIESTLEINKIGELVVGNIYEYLSGNVRLPINFAGYEKDLPIQIFLSVHRTHLKYDESMLSYLLFKYYNAQWWLPQNEDIEKIAKNISLLRAAISQQLNHPLVRQLDKITNRYSVFYSILTDMISEDPVALYENIKNKPEVFSSLAKEQFTQRFEKAKSRLWRAGINSIIYIFITKSIFVLALEVPATRYFGQPLDYLALTANMLFPPFLLFLVIMFTKVSSEENNKKVVAGVEEITFEEKHRHDPIVLRKPTRRNPIVSFIFNILYSLTFLISFGAVVWVLNKFNFTWVSTVIFLFFLVFVSFFSILIRRNVRRLVVVEERENLLNFILDFFFIPITVVGKWISHKFSKINVFMFVMDFIIEAPFKVLVSIAEQWTRYVRERKEDIE
ncbi:MAG: hypothetical protein WC415_01095 [Patescibacteria group bacterium]|jgi:hypothetical protein